MYAFFLDIDGTIYDGTGIAPQVIDAIADARKTGHMVFINTARAYIGMPQEVLDLPVDGFVCSFGLEVFADGHFIHRRFIPKDTVLAVASYAFQYKVPLYLEGEVRLDLNRRWSGSWHPHDLVQFQQMLGEHQLCKFSLPAGPSQRDQATFSADYDFYDIEVIPKGYSKTRGIQLVEEHFGLNRENTVAIGDSDTDLDMIRYAGIGVAMGNGSETLKAAADLVTESIDHFGVACAINRIIKADAE